MNFYELLLAKKLAGGGGGSAVINPLSVSANGTYSAPEGVDGYNPVEVAVPMPSGTYSIGANGDYDIAAYASVAVSVPGIVPSGTSNITANGVYDVTNYASASVNVGGTDTRFAETVMGTISGTVEDSTITALRANAFYQCNRITEISFPNVTAVGGSAFDTCTSISNVSLPNALNVGGYAFYNCVKITGIFLPKVSTINKNAFYQCTELETVSLPMATTISPSAFMYCSNLLSFYLMGSSIATLNNKNVFSGTPLSDYTTSTGGVYGSIYVPSSLYNTYIAANNWSLYAARIVSV